MKKCVKITFTGDLPKLFLQDKVQKNAKKIGIEGTASVAKSSKAVKIIAYGEKEAIEKFLDVLHKECSKAGIGELDVEPFLKDKDYRGVFRIIE